MGRCAACCALAGLGKQWQEPFRFLPLFALASRVQIRYTCSMYEISATSAFDFNNVALNPKFQHQEAALLNALLQSSDYGVLVSGLDREDIVANRRLGELFGVSPQQVVRTDPDAVRALALSRVRNPEMFEEVLRRVYADPMLTYEDEIELIGDPPRTLRRFTAPIYGADNQHHTEFPNQPLGRLWTFWDVTETRRLQSQVQAQLEARTLDYNSTAEILRVMNVLCSITMQHRSSNLLLADIVQQTRHLGGADCAALLLLTDESRNDLTIRSLEGVGCAPRGPKIPINLPLRQDKLLADLLSAFESLATGDGSQKKLTLFSNYNGSLATHLHWHSLAIVPLCQDGVLNGVFLMGLPEVFEPTQAVLRHMNAVADQIMLTLQTHKLQSELHQTLETLQLTQSRMVEIEKLRTAGTLAASIAHDIRNIMTAVQIEMEMALLPEEMASGLWEHLNRFSTLTHRLLAFARPGVLEMRLQDVGDILRRVLVLIAGQAEVHRVQIALELPEHRHFVAVDATQIEHLFVNLCLNGIQAMAQQGGLLRLTGTATSEWLEISVCDTGSGISPDIIDRIFEPFFTTRDTGTGLGLFSCKRIVEEHGGHLMVRSSLDNGATFTVMLPVGSQI